MRRGAIGAALFAIVLSTVAGCNIPVASSNALGLFVSSQTPSDVNSLAARLGVSVQGISGYTSQGSWSDIGSYQPPSTSLRLYLGVAMSASDSSPAQTPAHLGVYQQLAQSLVNAGQSYAILRIGWEWSTTYFSWGVQNTTPAQYVTAFDDIVTTMRSVPGQHFFFDWCAAADITPTNGSYAASYPGDQYVDYIGTDQYDNPGVELDRHLEHRGRPVVHRQLRQGTREIRECARMGPQRCRRSCLRQRHVRVHLESEQRRRLQLVLRLRRGGRLRHHAVPQLRRGVHPGLQVGRCESV